MASNDIPPDLLKGPIKRSISIAGHLTSVTLEPFFWILLERAADRRNLPLNALIAQIDAQRITVDEPPNLASAIRLWLAWHLEQG